MSQRCEHFSVEHKNKSKKITSRQNTKTQGYNFWQEYLYDIQAYIRLYNFDLRGHLRSLEVKIYLYLFSSKCNFFYSFIFFYNGAYEAFKKLIHMLKRGSELFLKFQLVFLGLCLNNLQEVKLRGPKRSKRGQSTQNWKIYLWMHFIVQMFI